METTEQEKENLEEIGYVLSYPRHTPNCKICGEQLLEDGWKYIKAKQFISWYHDECVMNSPMVHKRLGEK